MKSKHLILIVGSIVLTWYLAQPRPVRLPPPVPRASTALSLMTEPQDGIGPVLELIGGARSAIELVMYQFQDHEVADALIAAERRGVRVRVLLNHGYRGQADPTNEPVYAYLLAHGVGVKWTPALYDLTHEKSLEVDGGVLVIMTFNLTPRYYSSGREFGVFDRDSSDIRAAEAVFEADWHSTPIRAPTADGLVWSPGSESTLIDLINGTHSSLEIYNEEMADDRVTEALIAAAQRGAAVRVCMTYATPWKAAFNELTAAGVQVRTYASTASLYIHAKMVLVDQKEVFIGSQNFSSPSLEANRELGLVLSDPNLLIQLSSTFAQDWASARQY